VRGRILDRAVLLILYALSMFIYIIILIITNRKKKSPVHKDFLGVVFFMIFWASGVFFELYSLDLQQKIFWRNFTQIGSFGGSPMMFFFTIRFLGIDFKGMKVIKVLSAIFSALFILLFFTDSYHHLLRLNIQSAELGSFTVLLFERTILNKLSVVYCSAFSIFSEIMILARYRKSSDELKRQLMIIFLGILLISVGWWNKIIWLEKSSIYFAFVFLFIPFALLILMGYFRYSLFSYSPIAREKVFEIVDEGMVIFSAEGEVIDINPTAMNILVSIGYMFNLYQGDLEKYKKKEFNRNIAEYIKVHHKEWFFSITNCVKEKLEIKESILGYDRYFMISIYPIFDSLRNPLGSISVIKDITLQKKSAISLKIKSETDGLTGILNKESFIEYVQKYMDTRSTDSRSLFLVLDIDFFKEVNDTYGHLAGDSILKELSNLIKSTIRDNDIFGRIGGEEFGIFAKDIGDMKVYRYCERIRKKVSRNTFKFEEKEIKITISIGCAVCQEEKRYDDIFKKADSALYLAKHKGRDKCLIFSEKDK
jgi:diguanylate cyclase (GGDEF)-like protein